jgi:hypothetical protein
MGEDSDSDAICLDADGLRLREDCISLMLDEADGEGKQICKVCIPPYVLGCLICL